jgi:hypothetical protein
MAEASGDWITRALPELVAGARAEALAIARARLRDRYVDELLRAADAARPAPERTRPGPPARRAGTGLWVYGVVPESAAAPERSGIDGGPVESLRDAGLAALVTRVPMERFGEAELKEQLEDLARLEALARAHDEVLEAALDAGDVLPFRLCTIYESEANLRAMLERASDELSAQLRRIGGKAEWGVKAYLEERAGAGGSDPVAAPASGADYLARKSEARVAAQAARETVESVVAGVHARLAERASAAVLSRPHDSGLSGRDAEMILNAAYLVAREDAAAFAALVDELAERHRADGVTLELTGPWPPYHFVEGAPA